MARVLAGVDGLVAVELACEETFIADCKLIFTPDQRSLLVPDGVLIGGVEDDFHAGEIEDHCFVCACVLLVQRVSGLFVEGGLRKGSKDAAVG